MTPEDRAELDLVRKMVEENNDILRGLRRSNRITTVMRVLYWVVIVGLSFGAFYLVQPYFALLTGISGTGGQGGIPSLQQTQAAAQSLKQLLNQ
ncbi:MAG: hypothetical protein KGI69_02160 [Patescibacteria group bacterium]|nr:hypothetical protein [Patescibacteria group bacterium]